MQRAAFSNARFWLSLGQLFGQLGSAPLMPAKIPASRFSTGSTLSWCLFIHKLEISKQPPKQIQRSTNINRNILLLFLLGRTKRSCLLNWVNREQSSITLHLFIRVQGKPSPPLFLFCAYFGVVLRS